MEKRRKEGKHVASFNAGPEKFEAKNTIAPKRWRKIKGERRTVRTLKMRWILLGAIVLVICVMMVGAVLHVLDPDRWNPEEKSTLNVYELPAPDEAVLPKLAEEAESVFVGQPIAVARAFAEAEVLEARLALVRHPDAVKKRLERYPEQAISEIPTGIQAAGLGTDGEKQYPIFKAEFENGDARLIAVLATPDGLKVDWDCYARDGSATWENFASGKVDEATFRVFVNKGDYFNFDYSDEEKWRCYRMISPEMPDGIYGFVEAYSETAIAIAEALRDKSRGLERMILTVRADNPDSLARRQIRIVSVESRGWVEDP